MQSFIKLLVLKRQLRQAAANVARIHAEMQQACAAIDSALHTGQMSDVQKAQLHAGSEAARLSYAHAMQTVNANLDFFESMLASQGPVRRVALRIIPA